MEHIRTPKIENVKLLDRFNSRKPSMGTLYLTATHLIFVDPDNKKESWILYMHIGGVDKLPLTTQGSPLVIRCKTFLCATFVIPKERECHDVFITLQQLSQPTNIEDLYCFHYTSNQDTVDKSLGWSMFDLKEEYQRMGVPNQNWSMSLINQDYDICDTYPRHIYVPAACTTPILVGSSRFRSRGRLPVLSYLHANQAALCRCSQPLSGFSARCMEDEKMFKCIFSANPRNKNKHSREQNCLFVVDTRPRINAIANMATGKGFESENFYENTKFHFLGIENIHIMRSSLSKLIETCELKVPSVNAFLSGLESSGWLKHIKAILDTSIFIADALSKGVSVLVHCSDGWDRTAQVCSIACLLLDPYYRTIHGFQCLIEKEWLSFGHKFLDRCGLISGDGKESAPVFTQFLDSVWQLTHIYPTLFEFNERFLLTLHDQVYSCQYGTFIGNCEKERVDLRLSECTYSLWGYLAGRRREFVNPLYRVEQNGRGNSLFATENEMKFICPQNIRFWRGMYSRFESGVHPREELPDILSAMRDHCISLEDHARLLTKELHQLKVMLGHTDASSIGLTSAVPETDVGGDNIIAMGRLSVLSDAESAFGDSMSNASANGVSNSLRVKGSASDDAFVNGESQPFSLDHLKSEIESIALDWVSFRTNQECSCTTPFDNYTRKYYCWRCGEMFCIRCIDHAVPLLGHDSRQPVPVCRGCYRDIRRRQGSGSVDTP